MDGEHQQRAGVRRRGSVSADFSKVEAWVRVTNNSGSDWHSDIWIDLTRGPHPRRPIGPIGPIGPVPAAAATATGGPHGQAGAGRLLINVRLVRPGAIPTPAAILPYRNGLVVNEYEVVDVVRGPYAEGEIRVAQWAIRDGRTLAEARKLAGAAFTLTVERDDAHAELEGERLGSTSEASHLPLCNDVGKL